MGMFGRGDETVTQTFKGVDQLSPVVRGIRATMDRFKRDAVQGFGLAAGINVMGLATKGIGMVTDFLGDAGKAASDLAETQGKLSIVFKTQSDTIRDWARDSASSMGMSTQAALEATGTFGNFLQAMGTTEDAAVGMSETMVQLAADLGALNNTSADDALLALRSGLSGESEPLRKFGVDISDAAVKAQLLADGVQAVAGQFTQAQKIQGRYRIILRQTTTAQGNFAATVEDTAGSAKRSAAQIEDMKAAWGGLVNEIGNTATQFLGAVAVAFTPHNRALQKGIDFVNAYGLALERAVEAGEKLPAQLRAEALKAYTQAWQDYLDVNRDVINQQDQTGETFKWLSEVLSKDFAFATGQSVDVLTVLALRVKQFGGDADDFVLAVQMMMATGIDIRAIGMSYKRTFEIIEEGATDATHVLYDTFQKLPEALSHSVIDMKAAVKEGKTGIIEQFRDLAWQSKHPFAQVRYADWLRDKEAQSMRQMARAASQGKWAIVEQHRQLQAGIRAEYQGLPGYMRSIAGQVLDALSIIPGFGALDMSSWNDSGGGLRVDKKNPRKVARWRRRHGRGGGEVVSRGSGRPDAAASPIVVNVDGKRLFEIMDTRQGRAIAMGV